MAPLRTTILTSIMAPHRVELFNALAADPQIDLTVVYLARSDPSRRWMTYEAEMRYRREVLRGWAQIARGEGYAHVTSGLVSALRRARPQVLVVGGWDQLAYQEARLLRGWLGTRLIWWVESTTRDRRHESSATRWLKRRLLDSSDGCVVPGSASTAYVLGLGASPSHVWVAPNAVDNSIYRSDESGRSAPAEAVRFLYVGRLESSKGLAVLLDAWARMPTGVRLTLVGSGSLRGPLEDRSRLADMQPVEVVGHLERNELAGVYSDTDVFVFPSVSDPWGLVVNEAMASGLPVIATHAPGAVDDLVVDGQNGRLVPPLDPAALTAAMAELATSRELRLAMGRRSAERIEDFRPQDWANGMRDAAMTAWDGGS
jgi:glycosyltransferase involved in cell wall biosynthesis